MRILLLANVGNSDLAVPGVGRDELPRDARSLAARLSAERAAYWPRVQLPILTKAVEYVLAQGASIETIVLFVSDQDRDLAGEAEWQKDTCELGKLVKDKLLEQYPKDLKAKQIRLHTVQGNPADYDTMLDYYQHELRRIQKHYDPAALRVYLSLTGGTPAMNSMLLVVGNELFGPRAVNLYDAKERRQPFPLGVGRRLAARSLRTALGANLRTYQYAAALELAEAEGEVLLDSESDRRVLVALLTYARDRLAFNFADACAALDAAVPYATGRRKDHLLNWQNQVIRPGDDDRLRELYYAAEVRRLNHAYADWLEVVFRFQEGILRQAGLAHGLIFKDETHEYLDQGWIDAQAGLREYLSRAPRPGGGTGLDPHRSASRPLLRAILAFLAERQQDERLQRLVDLTGRLEPLASLRNDWVHRSQGVRRADVESAFGATLEEAAAVMAQAYTELTGRVPAASPYDAINAQCLELIEGGQR